MKVGFAAKIDGIDRLIEAITILGVDADEGVRDVTVCDYSSVGKVKGKKILLVDGSILRSFSLFSRFVEWANTDRSVKVLVCNNKCLRDRVNNSVAKTCCYIPDLLEDVEENRNPQEGVVFGVVNDSNVSMVNSMHSVFRMFAKQGVSVVLANKSRIPLKIQYAIVKEYSPCVINRGLAEASIAINPATQNWCGWGRPVTDSTTYMQLGIPLVASDTPVNRELLRGISPLPLGANDWISPMQDLLGRDSLRKKCADMEKRRIVEYSDWAIANRWFNVFSRV